MPIPLTVSDTPLVFDALPAIRVRHFRGDGPAIYTQARAYILKDSLQVSLAAFEREPLPDSRVALALAGAANAACLVLTLGPESAQLALCPFPQGGWPAGPLQGAQTLELPPPARFAGVDEQGWYWGAAASIGPGALARAGCRPESGEPFAMGLFKTAGAGAYGASFPPEDPAAPLAPGMPLFTGVPY